MGSILRLELAQLGFSASQHELRERRGFRAQAPAKRFERSRKCRSLGDRVSRVRRRHRASVAPCSTDPAVVPRKDTRHVLTAIDGLRLPRLKHIGSARLEAW